MKPISVRFKNFGPYREEVFVNFEELERNGLFLICGPTGAGKTTILDTICYALYGKSSGGIRGDLGAMRCKMSEGSEETVVEFTFSIEERIYRFVRTLHFGRKNLIDSHNCFVVEGETEVPIFENPKLKNVNQKAEELLGLSYDQFRQVIILPQGQFEKLLVSDSAEKEKLLVSLFKAEKWQRIADEMHDRTAEKDKELKLEAVEMKSRLSDHQCETVEELLEKTNTYKGFVLQCEEKMKAIEEMEQKQSKIREEAVRFHDQFMELDRWKQKHQSLAQKEAAFRQLERALERADRAETVKPEYDAFLQAKEQNILSRGKVIQLKERLQEGEENQAKIEAIVKRHEGGKPKYDQAVRDLALYENSKQIYAVLQQRKKELEVANKHYLKLKQSWEQQEEELNQSHQNWVSKMEAQQKTMREYESLQSIYWKGISGVLADRLKEGQPCPVCGSISHPQPAKIEGTKVTEQDLNQKNRQLQAASKAVEEAAAERTQKEAACQKARQDESEGKQHLTALQSAWKEMEKQKIEGIETAEQLEALVADLKGKIKKYDELTVKFQNDRNQIGSTILALKENLQQASDECQNLEKIVESQEMKCHEAAQREGFSSLEEMEQSLLRAEVKNRKKTELLQYRAEVKSTEEQIREQEEKLKNQKPWDLTQEQQKLHQLREERKQISKECILAQKTLENMEKDGKQLAIRRERYMKERELVDANLEFTNRLRGRTGISLQRYVLGVMLSSVTMEANRLLKNVHGCRYQLYRTDAISGSGLKGGLELEVLDAQSNERRSVTTLSGGEKFLVALSLAIGLSTVVQAQGNGMRLGAMFIDEGFGSLDQDSVYDALEVLQGIQKANGLVGIISHVDLLKEVIPSRIEVKKSKDGKNGSTLSVVL